MRVPANHPVNTDARANTVQREGWCARAGYRGR